MSKVKTLDKRILAAKSIIKITNVVQTTASIQYHKMKANAGVMEDFLQSISMIRAILHDASVWHDIPFTDLGQIIMNQECHNPVKPIFIVISSDRGLCGGLNVQLLKTITDYVNVHGCEFKEVGLLNIGSKLKHSSCALFKSKLLHHFKIDHNFGKEVFDINLAHIVTKELYRIYDEIKFDGIYLCYNTINHATVKPQILSIEKIYIEHKKLAYSNTTLDGDIKNTMRNMLDLCISGAIMCAVRSNIMSEHFMRMCSMKNASTSCENIILDLTLLRNKLRQETITSELIDIVAGASSVSNNIN